MYILKGFTYLNTLTTVPTGQYREQCTIFLVLMEYNIIITTPVIPKAAAISVDNRIDTFSHRRIRAIAITRIRMVDLMATLCFRITFVVFPEDARLSKAPK
jgi:hypothetical protein